MATDPKGIIESIGDQPVGPSENKQDISQIRSETENSESPSKIGRAHV